MEKNGQPLSSKDPSSYSNPEHAVTTHFDLDWTINFEEKTISGSVLLQLNVKENTVNQLDLDSRDLDITRVICEESGQQLNFKVGPHDANFGSKVTISLPSLEGSKKRCVRIFYSTSPKSSGLQWLRPDLTSGKRLPFLFSQCQPIHARSLMPCQDSPSVKATYSAVVKCDPDFTALMSALRDEQEGGSTPSPSGGKKIFRFRQPVAIPSYLLAIVVGDLVSEEIGPRSKVWAEKEVIQAAKHEFSQTEQMLTTAESLCGKYIWTQYDLLVLPPSFPYGGMENPCLTFVTPTLLAGDRSLADVIAHEICHSWTGNLVTSCSWEHFWLNEGFTVFLERKIQQRLHGTLARHLSAIEGWEHLKECIETRGKSDPLTCLVPNLCGVDPDDAFSPVPYEKGHALLWHLEHLLGGAEEFEPFLKAYLEKFRHSSIDTETFKSFLFAFFGTDKAELLNGLDWQGWLHTPGMPPTKPLFDTTWADACSRLAQSWKEWKEEEEECPFKSQDLDELSTTQKIVWLSKVLECSLTLGKVKAMERVYEMGKFTNAEIKFRWLRLCIQARWEERVEDVLQFLNSQGRMKFTRPIYRELYQWEKMREKTVANFHFQKNSMMHVSVHTLSKDLHLNQQEKTSQ